MAEVGKVGDVLAQAVERARTLTETLQAEARKTVEEQQAEVAPETESPGGAAP